jgi:hypothetical protein
MARIQVLKEHGTIQRYRQGKCLPDGSRCDACRAANADYQRAFQLGLVAPKSNVTSIKSRKQPAKPRAPRADKRGEVERAVRAQLKDFAADNPTQVQMAIVAAQILDNPERVALHPTTIRQLGQIVEGLTAGKKKKSRGRLAAVQALTDRKTGSS